MDKISEGTFDVEETFKKAASHLQSLVSGLDSEKLLFFYGLYKQATYGKCNVPSPNWYQVQARQKWQAWKALEDMTSEQAMINYIKAIESIDQEWETHARTSSWVVLSTLQNLDAHVNDEDKKLLDFVKEGNEPRIRNILNCDTKELDLMDNEGMLPIHWAADRGDIQIFKILVENGSDINARDVQGQTPMHYAASCGHENILRYLLSLNAEVTRDNSGLTPKDIADETVAFLF